MTPAKSLSVMLKAHHYIEAGGLTSKREELCAYLLSNNINNEGEAYTYGCKKKQSVIFPTLGNIHVSGKITN